MSYQQAEKIGIDTEEVLEVASIMELSQILALLSRRSPYM